MVVIVVRRFLGVGVTVLGEMPQMQPRQRLDGHRGLLPSLQDAGQKAFHVRADPVQQIGVAYPAYVRWSQRIVVRRGAGRQQYFRLAHAVLHGGCDQLYRLDAGQYTHLGLCRQGGHASGEQTDGKSKNTNHNGHSRGQEQVT